ncbi:endonuclease/exonuclease/phosphatase family protein [Streptomyces sp. NRRL S-340]|uniref:endonuclease/exonuclease/phosphatase family protein n=1 Tax=Streptomyces sp. NRRL S-340 TaxID=1463901 RepID=UPI00131D1AF3|nr:endonuclease/exonuclease/phosphatase family protein [Streptomyces sp. NRRL S-340]
MRATAATRTGTAAGPAGRGTKRKTGADRVRRRRRPRLLIALAVLWTCFTLVQRLLSGRWWVMLVPDLIPPVAFLLVPVLLMLGAGVSGLRRRGGRAERSTPAAAEEPGAHATAGCGDPAAGPGPERAAASAGGPGGPRGAGRPVPWFASRRTALLLVCALALVSACVSWSRNGVRLAALTHHVSSTAGDLRIVSWNTTWWGQDVDKDSFWRTLRAQRADVYLLQEYLHGIDYRQENLRPVDDLARIHREFPGYHVVTRGELITLSRYPVIGSKLVGTGQSVAGRPDAPWLEVYRAVKTLRVDIRVHGRPLSLYNVHIPVQIDPGPQLLSPSVFGMLRDRQRTRTAQFRGLNAELREQRAKGAAALVAGDFNSSPAMGELQELRSTMRDAADSGTDLYPHSWNELVPVLGLWRLDWAFSTGPVTVDRYRFDDMHHLSDHRAQVLEVSL